MKKFLIGLLIAVTGCTMFRMIYKFMTAVDQVKQENTRTKMIAIEKNYNANRASYEKISDSLTTQLNKDQNTIKEKKQRSKQVGMTLMVKIRQLKNYVPQQLSDTIQTMVKLYAATQDTVDSLHAEQAATVDELIREKDEQIANCDTSYQQMKVQLIQCIAENELKDYRVWKTEQKFKRQNRIIKILTIVAAIASAGAAASILTH